LELAKRQALMKDISQENAQLLRKLNHLPTVPGNIRELVHMCMAGKSIQGVVNEMMLTITPSIASSVGGKALEAPLILAPQVEDDIINLDWSMNHCQRTMHFEFWSPEALTIFDEIEDKQSELLQVLRSEVQERKDFQERLNKADQEIVWEHGCRTIRYKEGEAFIDIDANLAKWERDSDFEMPASETSVVYDMRKPSPTPSKNRVESKK